MKVIFFIAISLLGLGVGLLGISIIPIQKIIRRLPNRKLRKKWYVLLSFTVFFLFSYVIYGLVFWDQFVEISDLIVPGVFFFGALYVWLISILSLETTLDIGKVYRLETESNTDPLTGAYNRRYLEQRLEKELLHSKSYGSPLSILMIDIDHFKMVNDTEGHIVGDQVIATLAKIFLTLIRGSDVLVRLGGDEFIIIALNTNAEAAKVLAGKILGYLNSQLIDLETGQEIYGRRKITVSIGIAELTEDVTDADQLISNADQALYCSKREGPNRISIYPVSC